MEATILQSFCRALAEALISSHWLSASETQDREQVARAVGEIVAEWTTRWI
jgi:hypothetical protein